MLYVDAMEIVAARICDIGKLNIYISYIHTLTKFVVFMNYMHILTTEWLVSQSPSMQIEENNSITVEIENKVALTITSSMKSSKDSTSSFSALKYIGTQVAQVYLCVCV